MIWKILLGLAIALEFVFVPLFLKYSWPNKCWKSFRLKMVCSALFFATGLLCIKISANSTPYATTIMWGLFFGWVGDLFLHLITDKIIVFGIGLFAFLTGHVFYIVAFRKAFKYTYPASPTFAWYEILSVVLIFVAVLIFALIKKINIKDLKMIPVAMYLIVISTMLVKALSFAFGELAYGMNDHMVMIFLTVALGAVLFVLSDGSLGIILAFEKQKKNRPLKIFNIATYFAAQILLGLSIFFVRTPELIFG